MTEAPPWDETLALARLPPTGTMLHLEPPEAVRAALARHAGLLALPALSADLEIVPDGRGGARAEGRLRARVVQACVVTLDPVEAELDEPVDVRFVPAGAEPAVPPGAEIAIPPDAEDPPEPIRDGGLPLGRVLTELLVVALDPYPRSPGAAFEPPASGEVRQSPFAALARLKRDVEPS